MLEEIWKPCTLDARYQISNLGRFKTQLGSVHELKQHTTGYIRACINAEAHQLVDSTGQNIKPNTALCQLLSVTEADIVNPFTLRTQLMEHLER